VIRFDRVAVQYPRADTPAVVDVSLDAARGWMTAIVGPNGSGKSTLVRALLRRQPLLRGSITVDGTDVHALPPREFARRVAVVPQREEPVFPMRLRDYVSLGRHPHTGAWRSPGRDDLRAVSAALERAGVSALADRPTDELSGGEWQRARIARALAQDGEALVLDEPTTFLDIAHEMATFELLDGLARDGHAVLLVSHQLNLVARFAQRIVLLHHGVVVADGDPSSVMRGETLERVYEWPLVVTRDPAVGAPALVPLRNAPVRRAPDPPTP
jgi:iron complex transport system ATP-binding protein